MIEGRPPKREAHQETAARFRKACELAVHNLFGEFVVERTTDTGEDRITQLRERFPNRPVIIVASHISDMDVAAAVTALGKDFDFQITSESLNFEKWPQWAMFSALGMDRFSSLDYKEGEEKAGKSGRFNPANFEAIKAKMHSGRTPWIAIHPFAPEGKMRHAKIGPIFLAQISEAVILPVALDVQGATGSMEKDPLQVVKQLRAGMATFRIGEPIDLAKVDIGLIQLVLANKRGASRADVSASIQVHHLLKQQAEQVARAIAQLLPTEKRGLYGGES
jgi:hypothetical protein